MPDRELRGDVGRLLLAGLVLGALLLLAGPPAADAGLLVLIVTPLSRVAWLAVAWARRGEWRFFWTAAGVLLLEAAAFLLKA